MNITETTTILRQNFSQASKAIAIASTILITANNSATAQTIESNNQLISPRDNIEGEVVDGMEQINSVSELLDVNPGDWAYEALRSLSDRYGCISGYPDGTYRGHATLTRYEFAVGLNSCLQNIQQLLATGSVQISSEDIATLEKLQKNYSAELVEINSRLDRLRNQYRTTRRYSVFYYY